MKNAIQSVFCGLEASQRIYITPNIPLDKYKNARNATRAPADDRPVVLIDLSKMHQCHQALLFCTRGIYFRYDGLPADIGSGQMTYGELFREKIHVAGTFERVLCATN
jgi:hypothetical protein